MRHLCAKVACSEVTKKEAFMVEATIIGLDLGKNVFQAHGSNAEGHVAFRKRLRRDKVLEFFSEHDKCSVAMEAWVVSRIFRTFVFGR